MKRLQVLLVLFAGVVFGSSVTGCFAIWLGVARADGATPPQGQLITAPCNMPGPNGGTFAVASFPGASAEDIAGGVFVARPGGDPNASQPPIVLGSTKYVWGPGVLGIPSGYVADGSMAVSCPSGASSVMLYVRQ